jgi:chorismate mutase/prephenate dehydratase
MSNPASTIDVAPGASAPDASSKEAADPRDGWRTSGLAALRGELDRIDNKIHDLLKERAGVVEYVARSGKPAAFRPGREAAIIRQQQDAATNPKLSLPLARPRVDLSAP